MFRECRHVLTSGKKCQGAAVANSSFCFFHRNSREHADAPVRPGTPFVLPYVEDAHSALIAVNDVFRAMGQGRIKRAEAGTYLYGIQIAAKLVVRIEQSTIKPVRSLCYDNYGTELAQEKTICEPPEDCLHCTRRNSCDDFEDYEDEVEELEQQLDQQEPNEQEESEDEEEHGNKQEQDDSVIQNLQAMALKDPRSRIRQDSSRAESATKTATVSANLVPLVPLDPAFCNSLLVNNLQARSILTGTYPAPQEGNPMK